MDDMNDSDPIFLAYLKVLGLAVANFLVKISMHEALSNIFLTLSILYLLWRWWRDIKKTKQPNDSSEKETI